MNSLNNQHQALLSSIDRCMIRDRFRLRKALRSRQQRGRTAAAIEASRREADSRRDHLPPVAFDAALPITAWVDDIKHALQQSQVVIVAGETGSGKTTQLPKLCLDMGRGVFGMIGHTQPRRVAARTVASRIAAELSVELGDQVGYQVRFTDKTTAGTHIKLMTDGILLAETQQDRFLESYDTLIIDEAHERSLNIDFLLGYLKRILPRRPDLKVIVTSATIDVARFSRHFGNAPVIEVSGRTWPVDVHYRPLAPATNSRDSDELIYQGALDALREIVQLERHRQDRGDVLVFLSGEREIRELASLIRKSQLDFEVLPLYSRLSVAEQNRVFTPHRGSRVVLATNVAETSLTVPGIRYVIDPGLARISRYAVRSKVQQLPVEPVSRASAEQRKGRCGRLGPGVCFRLYDEEDFAARPEFTTPEILRTNLASVILQMLSLHLGDIAKFPFIERPEQRQINDGFHLLNELGAVDDKRNLTRLGKEMARLPIDLRLARMLIEAGKNGCLVEVLIIVSALAVMDPRERPHDAQQQADAKHKQHWHEQSDFMAFVNLWNAYEARRQVLSRGSLRKFCHENFLSYVRMQEWRDNHRQLLLLAGELGLRRNVEPADYAGIHRSLLAGLLGNIGERLEDNEYQGARNRRHFIFPGSSQFSKKPRWIVSAELVETSRLYGRTVAQIDNEWIEPLARHLVKRNYRDPFFDVDHGQVFAYEEVSLYGVRIIKNRRVDFGSINPLRARQIFIQSALVEQQLVSDAAFYRHNARLIEEIEQLESRTRKRDILVDSYTLYRFYDARLPEHICSGIDLDAWRRVAERTTPKRLYLDKAALMKQPAELPQSLYPDELEVADTRLALDYHFDPQHEHDGVSVNVPVAMLRQVSETKVDWVIPGLLREKCLALIKSLPKSVRRNFVPAPDYADRVVEGMEYDGRPLVEVLAQKLFRLTGVDVQAAMFDERNIDKHLRMNIKVVGDKGELLDSGRDLMALRARFAATVDEQFSRRPRHAVETDQAVDWQFGELPDQVEFRQSGMSLKGYPAIVDKGECVAVEVVDSKAKARWLGRQGLLRLFLLQCREQRKYLEKRFPRLSNFAIYHATHGSHEGLLTDLVEAVFNETFLAGKPSIRTEQEFRKRLAERQYLVGNANRLGQLMEQVYRLRHEIEQSLAGIETDLTRPACDDMRAQLARLTADRFIRHTPLARLEQYPRYLAAIGYRIDKLRGNLARDRQNTEEVHRFEERYLALGRASGGVMPGEEFDAYRWMLEEYRVSLFAQPLGTSVPVSAKRLERLWQDTAVKSKEAGRR